MDRVPKSPLRGQLTVVRRATLGDVDLLVRWHADPDISQHWDDETFSQEEMRARLLRPDVDPYIVEHEAEPVGYLQAWFDDDAPDAGPDVAGLDMFLVASARGHGLGPDAARALGSWLLRHTGTRRVIVDPHLSNERAVRAWAKAGFRAAEHRTPDEQHTERWMLMVME